MNHKFLMALTASMQMKTICINNKPYLSRYFVGEGVDGGQWWLHHYLAADTEPHLHSHPWEARSIILCGGYKEQTRSPNTPLDDTRDFFSYYRPGSSNTIFRETLHRIVEVEPNTWTLLYVKPGRLPQWYFVNNVGEIQTVNTSGEDWWKDCGTRLEIKNLEKEVGCGGA